MNRDRPYENEPIDRQDALDQVIEAGLLIQPARIDLKPSGQGYDVTMPVECLAKHFNAAWEMGYAAHRREQEHEDRSRDASAGRSPAC